LAQVQRAAARTSGASQPRTLQAKMSLVSAMPRELGTKARPRLAPSSAESRAGAEPELRSRLGRLRRLKSSRELRRGGAFALQATAERLLVLRA
jgi:hypothetical protein